MQMRARRKASKLRVREVVMGEAGRSGRGEGGGRGAGDGVTQGWGAFVIRSSGPAATTLERRIDGEPIPVSPRCLKEYVPSTVWRVVVFAGCRVVVCGL